MQTQTQTAAPKSAKKIAYVSSIVAGLGVVLAYIACSVYFKFIAVNEETMGTMFYSWRVEGADDSGLKEAADKIPGGPENQDKIDMFKTFSDDTYPIHLPRLAANHLTFAYPNMSIVYGLRKSIVAAQNKLIDMETNKALYEEFSKKVSLTLFFSPERWEGSDEVEKTVQAYYNTLGPQQKKLFVDSIEKLITLYINLVEEEEYQYTGVTPSSKAVEDLASLIAGFGNTVETQAESTAEEGSIDLTPYINNNKDAKIFLTKGLKIKKDALEKLSVDELSTIISQKFFESLTSGVLYPYFSLGYSTAVNTMLYLCLDMDNLDYERDTKIEVEKKIEEIAKEQKMGENRITAFGAAIAYGMAKALSPKSTIGEEHVKKTLNPIVFALFTPKVSTPSEQTVKNLPKIIDHLREKRDFIKGLSN